MPCFLFLVAVEEGPTLQTLKAGPIRVALTQQESWRRPRASFFFFHNSLDSLINHSKVMQSGFPTTSANRQPRDETSNKVQDSQCAYTANEPTDLTVML